MTTDLTRLKRVVSLHAGGTPAVAEEAFWAEPGDGWSWVSISDMSGGAVVTQTDRELTSEGLKAHGLEIAPPGTLLFAMYASVGAVAELGVAAAWNQALLAIRPRKELASLKFVRYWLEHLRPSLSGLVRSNTQDNLNAEQVGNLPFPAIRLDTQGAIANYLDTETARIDTLITKKQNLMEALGEWRKSMMAAACGGELTSALPRLRSSVPWLETVPCDWGQPSLKLVARLGSGHTPSRSQPEWWEDCTIPWITTGEVARMRSDRYEYVEDTRERISEVGLANSAAEVGEFQRSVHGPGHDGRV